MSQSRSSTVSATRAKLVEAENDARNLTASVEDLQKYFLDIDDQITDALKQDRERLLRLNQSAVEIERGNQKHLWCLEKLFAASESCDDAIKKLSAQLDFCKTRILLLREEVKHAQRTGRN